MAAGRDAVDRNSDGSYDAVHSGFGKDYHGQDVFGERIGGMNLGAMGGGKFGGFEEGHVGLDKDNTQKYAKLSSEDLAQTESMPKSAFEADNSNESSEEEAGSGMIDSLRDLNSDSSEENSNVGSLDTSMQIGENEDEKEKSSFTDKMDLEKGKELEDAVEKAKKDEEAKREKDLKELEKVREECIAESERLKGQYDSIEEAYNSILEGINTLETKNPIEWVANKMADLGNSLDLVRNYARAVHYELDEDELKGAYKKNGKEALIDKIKDIRETAKAKIIEQHKNVKAKYNKATSLIDKINAPIAEKTKSSFTDKMEESKEEAKAGPNMAKASVGESDYLTKANKDSTKKEAPSRNDFPNHIADTFKGVVDKISDNTTAKALGIQSLEDFAKEKGVDPNKLSTMKAYRSYQTKQIAKALPNLIKKVGGYFNERIKDAFDLSQLPERIRNTLARYNAATLVGATILSIQSGAGLQASIDQALTMVDPVDQPAVSDFLEDVLNDEGTVADLSNAIDDALAPEQTSNTEELDDSIVNIGRKDNTDYSDFNAGLGTSGTTSDADVKVFIARNVKADPILRRMISKMGK